MAEATGVFTHPRDALDRLYRPEALDVPVLVARDGPISTLDPASVGAFTAPPKPVVAQLDPETPVPAPQVLENEAPRVALMAVRPAWVRVKAADGSVLFEKILDAGEEYVLPATEEPPLLRAGMSGSVYFSVNGELFGPAGQGTNTVRDVALDIDSLTENYSLADLTQDPELARIVALAEALQTESAD